MVLLDMVACLGHILCVMCCDIIVRSDDMFSIAY